MYRIQKLGYKKVSNNYHIIWYLERGEAIGPSFGTVNYSRENP